MPRYLKERNPNLIIAQFWHIPWPNRETFRVFPWKEELLDGLLGNDLLGFHLRYHCQNFLETVDRTIEARIDQEQGEIVRGDKSTLVRPFPISIDFERQAGAGGFAPRSSRKSAKLRRQLGRRGDILGIGIERIDYTKGIPERLRGARSLLRAVSRSIRERLTFVQVGVPSRGHIASYQQIDKEIDRLVEQINWKWGTPRWRPVVYFKRHFSPVEMTALHRLADFCIVSSLHDGMNLVAKEFVASRSDEDGVLLLSQFAGAALELTDAVLFNPFAIDELAEAIHQAVEMPPAERKKRMQRMRSAVQDNNVYRWAGKILSALLKFEMPDAPARRSHDDAAASYAVRARFDRYKEAATKAGRHFRRARAAHPGVGQVRALSSAISPSAQARHVVDLLCGECTKSATSKFRKRLRISMLAEPITARRSSKSTALACSITG